LKSICLAALIVASGAGGFWVAIAGTPAKEVPAGFKPKAALSVVTVTPRLGDLPMTLSANGGIAAWQEAIVGSEVGGLRVAEVHVNVGDVVKRGQELARFANEAVAAELAQQEASVEELDSALSEALANAERAVTLGSRGMVSTQHTTQALTSKRSAQARLASGQARLRAMQIRFNQTRLVAPDDGVISSRTATVGAVAQQGQELFRLIRKQRIEWRAEVTSSDLPRIKPGQTVTILAANGETLVGKVRVIAPSVDRATSNATVYVDLPAGSKASAGMFASGQFELGRSEALMVRQSAVVMRDGFSYVYRVGADNKVVQTKVALGRRLGDQVEILHGIHAETPIVAQGAGFLANGDLVKVVPAAPAAPIARRALQGQQLVSN